MRTSLGHILIALIFSFLLGSPSALAQSRGIAVNLNEKRIALVIGNADYKTAPLRNPVNDARSISKMLKRLGFEVIKAENAGYRQIRRAVIEFGRRIKGGGVGLFYFSGHGMQANSANYLIPTNADVHAEEELEAEAVDLASVLSRMASAGNRLNIVILDSCRDNPFVRSFKSRNRVNN